MVYRNRMVLPTFHFLLSPRIQDKAVHKYIQVMHLYETTACGVHSCFLTGRDFQSKLKHMPAPTVNLLQR